MNTNEIVGIGVMILCGVVLVVQILGLLLSIFKKMTTPKVETLKARKDIKGLIKALRYRKDEGVRQAAAEVLGKIGDPRAVEPLIAALKDAEWIVREAAAKALGKIGDTRAVEPLIAALKDQNSWARAAAAESLGKIGDPRAVELLIATLKDKDSGVRKAAAKALDHLGWEPAQDEIAGWYWIAKRDWDKCVALGALTVEPLIAALKDAGWSVRADAAKALGKIGDPRVVEPLIAALKDKDEYVRKAADEALVKIGAPAVEPLIAALKGENKDVRQAAAAMLGRLGWQPGRDETAGWYWMVKGDWDKCVALGALAVEPLIAALKDGSFSVRKAAAYALGEIKDPRAVEPLIAALKDKDEYVRKAAAYALGKIKDPRAVEPLIAALKDQNSDVRKAAAYALGEIKDPRAVEPLIAALKDAEWIVRTTAAYALGEIKDPRAVEPLIAALGDEKSSGVRKAAAAKALGKIKDPRAVEPLIAALKDKDSDVRKAAAEALDHLGWKPAQDESAAWYWATKGKWNACVDIGAPAVQPLITTLGSTNDPYTRRDVAQALVKLYQKSSISQEDREQILAVRNHLIRIHDDQPHIDEFKDCCTNQPHTDIELGVEFPL